jgi:uncharacterized membrane protein YdbT with pleckstrin-like domain
MASYVERVLQPGEMVLATTRLHWLIYLSALPPLIVAALFGAAYFYVPDEYQIYALGAAGLFGLLTLLRWLAALIRRVTTELAVTDRRVIHKTGLFSRHTREMTRSKVESVDVDQSFLGRIFGYGTVRVHGVGGDMEPFQYIADPLNFRSQITAG